MRLPNRKPGKYTFPTFDPYMTQERYDAMQSKLQHLLNVSRPKAIKEVQTYGENGDFSENAEYQIAKGRLRGLNRAVDELQQQLGQAMIITVPSDSGIVQIGSTVTAALENGVKVVWKILGPTESNPDAGIISYQSAVGAALLGKQAGDEVVVELQDRRMRYTVLGIE